MKKTSLGKLRIIGGKWRSRQIQFPALPGLRPTQDHIRETVFNWLSPYIAFSTCLDLFAGSGALGFEALSRGAKWVTFIDASGRVIEALQNTAKQFNVTSREAEFLLADCSQDLSALSQKSYDIVFLDAPFHKNLVSPTLECLAKSKILSKEAFIYLEIERGAPHFFISDQWEILRQKETSSLRYYLLRCFNELN